MSDLKWYFVPSPTKNSKGQDYDIGAMGLLNNKIAVIVTFFDDLDANHDGSVSNTEYIFGWGQRGIQAALVAKAAPLNKELLKRCPEDIMIVQKETFALFARELMLDAAFKVYFMRGVGAAGGVLANAITTSLVKNIVVRKAFSIAVGKIVGKGLKAIQ